MISATKEKNAMGNSNKKLKTMSSCSSYGIDLKLPESKKPSTLSEFENLWGSNCHSLDTHTNACLIRRRDHTYAIGSANPSVGVYHHRDLGLFQCIYEVWKNHWNLRTSPEDWWYPVACKIAKAIDKAAQENERSYNSFQQYKVQEERNGTTSAEEVRNLFVGHQGKKTIEVKLPAYTIYDANYDYLFSTFANELEERIKLPQFALEMQNDFSTSSSIHKISSQINLMASMQQFFEYKMTCCGCGIKGVEMLGDEDDWNRLGMKIRQVRSLLSPIKEALKDDLSDNWWDHVTYVFDNLALTRRDPQNPKIRKFWADILMIGDGWEYGSSGLGHRVDAYNGWLIQFLLGSNFINISKVQKLPKELSGLNKVPLEVTMDWCKPPISDEAELISGIMGFTLNDSKNTFNGVPSLQPYHMWAMMLPKDSPLRK